MLPRPSAQLFQAHILMPVLGPVSRSFQMPLTCQCYHVATRTRAVAGTDFIARSLVYWSWSVHSSEDGVVWLILTLASCRIVPDGMDLGRTTVSPLCTMFYTYFTPYDSFSFMVYRGRSCLPAFDHIITSFVDYRVFTSPDLGAFSFSLLSQMSCHRNPRFRWVPLPWVPVLLRRHITSTVS